MAAGARNFAAGPQPHCAHASQQLGEHCHECPSSAHRCHSARRHARCFHCRSSRCPAPARPAAPAHSAHPRSSRASCVAKAPRMHASCQALSVKPCVEDVEDAQQWPDIWASQQLTSNMASILHRPLSAPQKSRALFFRFPLSHIQTLACGCHWEPRRMACMRARTAAGRSHSRIGSAAGWPH